MKRVILIFLFLSLNQVSIAKDDEYKVADLFFIDQMNSHNDEFALYFKTRDKAILARGENSNYINDYPKDLIYMIIKQKIHPL